MNLCRLYEGRKKELVNRNGLFVGVGEKILYHGTSEVSCSSIMLSNFNRSYAGQNADGTQLMFVARVLTNHYAQGQANMKTPPVCVAPDHKFDSVVENTQNPSMFVVFHDCQAYPDYLITFK
ncbi:Poly [ADP-ribose] polymerase 14 [Anabarilius grahami]|uniref:Poly [ADP-ribose] polymerase 14 n=1 Tax=Anabarilius grahami TaxID=495550 RepID=A0A3N0XYN5_ANAGA|nr:Poly [ADP-ribose] polymerase 14 [Anabarilius grahami]